MADDTLLRFEQPMSRADAAAYLHEVALHEVADKLDADGALTFRTGGESTSVSVPERLPFEVDVERAVTDRGAAEMEVDFELEWCEDEEGTATSSLKIE